MNKVNELSAAVSEILIDEEALQHKIAELGAEISEDYRGQDQCDDRKSFHDCRSLAWCGVRTQEVLHTTSTSPKLNL